MNYQFRKAKLSDIPIIWEILQLAILRRKADGSTQWQDGYPNIEILQKDIKKKGGYVLTDGQAIIGYCCLLINDEPEYKNIEGDWITNNDFVVFHRVAIAEQYIGRGFAKIIMQHIEDFTLSQNIYSIKADTNYDNIAMKKVFKNLDYAYCGKVYFRGSPREAFEKTLNKTL